MYSVETEAKMIVPDWISEAVRKILHQKDRKKQQELLRDLALGLVDAEKWEITEDENYLQF